MPSTITSPAWLNSSGDRSGSHEPQFAYINESGQYVQTIFTGERDLVTNRWIYNRTPIPLGTFVVADWFGTRHGLRKTGDDTCLVPMHVEPSLTPPDEGYHFVVRIPMLVQGIEQILPWYCYGNIAQKEMGLLRDVFRRKCDESSRLKNILAWLSIGDNFLAWREDATLADRERPKPPPDRAGARDGYSDDPSR